MEAAAAAAWDGLGKNATTQWPAKALQQCAALLRWRPQPGKIVWLRLGGGQQHCLLLTVQACMCVLQLDPRLLHMLTAADLSTIWLSVATT